jgi:serine/threonine-protein kinase RsbW
MSILHKSLILSSSIDQLSTVEQLIDELHERGDINDAIYGNILVASSEAFLNAIQHGNNNDPTKKTHVTFDIESNNELVVTIKDEGKGFPFETLPDPTDPENLEKINGRGVFIIQNLADSVEFERNGATLKMKFNLEAKDLVEA